MLRYPTFTTAIYDQYRATFNGPGATAAGRRPRAAVPAAAARRAAAARPARLRPHRCRRGPPGAAGPARRADRCRRCWRSPALVGAGARRCPLASLAHLAGPRRLRPSSTCAELVTTTGSTLGLAAVAAAITTAMALPTGWLAVRRRGPVATLLERSTYLGSAVPGIVVALALVTVSIRATPWLYQTVPVLLAAYAILFLPRALVTVRAAVEQSPRLYDDVAASLGASAPGPAAPRHAAAAGAGHRRRRGAGVPRRGHRADRDAAAGAHRDDDAGDGVLVGQQRPGVRRRRPVRGGDGAAVGSGYRAALPRRPTRSDHMSALTVLDVTKSFGRTPVLTGIDLHVPAGTTTALLGPSGCGKTTLLRIVAGFDDPDSGTVELGGRVVAGAGRGVPPHGAAASASSRRRAACSRTCRSPPTSPSACRGGSAATGPASPSCWRSSGWTPTSPSRSPHQLSGGQQQRVALARALAPEPVAGPAGRAVLLARRLAARGDPAGGHRGAGRHRRHRGAGHPRPGRGAVDGVAGGGAARRPAGPAGRSADALPHARATSTSRRSSARPSSSPPRCASGRAHSEVGVLELERRVGRRTGPGPAAPRAAAARPTRRPDRPVARVRTVDFFGHDARVGLELASGRTVSARLEGRDLPEVGDSVGLAVRGAALPFPAEVEARPGRDGGPRRTGRRRTADRGPVRTRPRRTWTPPGRPPHG